MLHRHDMVLFIGDSITHAHRRPEEFHDCYSLGCGYVKMIAATLNADRPDLQLRFANRGECGHTVHDLAKRWQQDCLDLRPDVVSILIGINDSNPGGNGTVGAYEQGYRDLLERTREALPRVRLVLVEPFGLAVPPLAPPLRHAQDGQLRAVRQRQPVVRRVADAFGATYVPLQLMFDEAVGRAPGPQHWALDGIHPSAAGHCLIARQWLSVVCRDLPDNEASSPDKVGNCNSAELMPVGHGKAANG